MAHQTRLMMGMYGAMLVAAVVWGGLRGDIDVYHHPHAWFTMPYAASTGLSVVAGAAIALITVAATRWLVARTKWARVLHLELRALIGPQSGAAILGLALASGICEEMLFRGAMQTSFGLLPTAVVFGLAHVGGSRQLLPWTLWAMLMGLLLGATFEAFGVLVGPILAHVAINYINLRFLVAHDPSRKSTPPGRGDLFPRPPSVYLGARTDPGPRPPDHATDG